MKTTTMIAPRFHPGQVVATPAMMKKVPADYALSCLQLHLAGNWGLCCEEDWETNDHALANEGRLLSVYALPDEAGDFWIITEWDRSVTTLLLPSDY